LKLIYIIFGSNGPHNFDMITKYKLNSHCLTIKIIL